MNVSSPAVVFTMVVDFDRSRGSGGRPLAQLPGWGGVLAGGLLPRPGRWTRPGRGGFHGPGTVGTSKLVSFPFGRLPRFVHFGQLV